MSKSNNEYSTIDNSYYPKRVIDSDNNHSFMELIYHASLYVDADKVDNLRWLNYCINLKELTISTSNTELLGQIKYLPNLESLTIINPEKDYTKSLLYDNCKFIIRANKLKKLHINIFNVEPGIVEEIDNLEVLNLDTSFNTIAVNYDFDYASLSSLKKVIVNMPLSLLVHIDKSFVELTKNGLKVYMPYKNDYIDITDKCIGVIII